MMFYDHGVEFSTQCARIAIRLVAVNVWCSTFSRGFLPIQDYFIDIGIQQRLREDRRTQIHLLAGLRQDFSQGITIDSVFVHFQFSIVAVIFLVFLFMKQRRSARQY
jgi:hypothetical protein